MKKITKNEEQRAKNSRGIGITFFVLVLLASMLLGGNTQAQTKPAPGTDPNSLIYVFYLYYSNGQLLADRDYTVKYEVASETFVPEIVSATSYRGEIANNKSEVVKTFQFDPQKGDPSFMTGKVAVRAPYAADGVRANFFDPSGRPILAIFVSDSAICDGDGFCNSQSGEDTKTCPADCQVVRTSPIPTSIQVPTVSEGFDLIQILIYVFAGAGVGVGAWFGWRWWKKKREGDFPLPPPPSISSPPIFPPLPPNAPLG